MLTFHYRDVAKPVKDSKVLEKDKHHARVCEKCLRYVQFSYESG